jgi:hypothetical protein
VTVGVVDADRIVRLDVALMDHRSVELALDDVISKRESFRRIAAIELKVIRDVGRLIRAVLLVPQFGQKNFRLRLHRLINRHDWR